MAARVEWQRIQQNFGERLRGERTFRGPETRREDNINSDVKEERHLVQ